MPAADQPRNCPGYHPGEDEAQELRPDEHLCRSCVRRVRRQLQQLGQDMLDLDATVSRQTVGGNLVGGRRGRREVDAPLPYQPQASTERRAILSRLRAWAEFVAESCGEPLAPLPSEHLWTFLDLRRSVDALIEHVTWLRTDEQGPSLALAIAGSRGQLRAALDRREERWFAGVCGVETTLVDVTVEAPADEGGPERIVARTRVGPCEADLYARPGRAVIVCDGYGEPRGIGGCGAMHPALVWHKRTVRLLRAQLLPLPAILEVLPQLIGRDRMPAADTLKKWRQRGRLRPAVNLVKTDPPALHVRNEAGVLLYPGGHVLDLVLDESQRTGPKRARSA